MAWGIPPFSEGLTPLTPLTPPTLFTPPWRIAREGMSCGVKSVSGVSGVSGVGGLLRVTSGVETGDRLFVSSEAVGVWLSEASEGGRSRELGMMTVGATGLVWTISVLVLGWWMASGRRQIEPASRSPLRRLRRFDLCPHRFLHAWRRKRRKRRNSRCCSRVPAGPASIYAFLERSCVRHAQPNPLVELKRCRALFLVRRVSYARRTVVRLTNVPLQPHVRYRDLRGRLVGRCRSIVSTGKSSRGGGRARDARARAAGLGAADARPAGRAGEFRPPQRLRARGTRAQSRCAIH